MQLQFSQFSVELTAQAAEINVDMDDLKRKIALMKEFAGKSACIVSPGDPTSQGLADSVSKISALWAEVASAGLTLVAGNSDLMKIALDHGKVGQWLESPGPSVLKAIVKTRERLMKAQKDIEAASKSLQSRIDDFESDEGTLPQMLEMSMPEAFTSELINENFDDLVSQAAAKHTLSVAATLDQFEQKLKAAYTAKGDSAESDFFNELAQSGDQSWQGNVPLTSTSGKSFEDVYVMAEATLLAKIPGKLVKGFTVQAEKALGLWVGLGHSRQSETAIL